MTLMTEGSSLAALAWCWAAMSEAATSEEPGGEAVCGRPELPSPDSGVSGIVTFISLRIGPDGKQQVRS